MITGDNEVTAKAIGKSLGINNIITEVLLDQKSTEVERLQKKDKTVVFIDDGTNDAPTLTR